MAQLLPTRWKQAFENLRADLQHALERWIPRRRNEEREDARLPVQWREAVGQLRDEITSALARWLPRRSSGSNRTEEWMPSFFFKTGPVIDVEETDDEVIVAAEMPGLEKDDFSVEVTTDRLVLRGEKRRQVEEQRSGYAYSERSFGTFARVVPLPCEVAAEKAKAMYKNGLLRITLPKTEWAKVKRVRVQIH